MVRAQWGHLISAQPNVSCHGPKAGLLASLCLVPGVERLKQLGLAQLGLLGYCSISLGPPQMLPPVWWPRTTYMLAYGSPGTCPKTERSKQILL